MLVDALKLRCLSWTRTEKFALLKNKQHGLQRLCYPSRTINTHSQSASLLCGIVQRTHHMQCRRKLSMFQTKISTNQKKFKQVNDSKSKTDQCLENLANTYPMKHTRIVCQGTGLNVAYLDLGPRDGPIALALHGAPGSSTDFEVFFTPLIQAGVRLLVPNLPGYGITLTEDRSKLPSLLSTQGMAQFTLDFLTAVDVCSVDMLIGHSLGCLPAISLAATTSRFRSLVLLNNGGIHPHSSARPYFLIQLAAWGSHHPILRYLFEPMLLRGFKQRGFTVEDIDLLKASILYSSQLNFEYVKQCAQLLKSKVHSLPTLYAVVKSDKIIDWETGLLTGKVAGLQERNIAYFDAAEKLIRGPGQTVARYPKALVFDRGGHFVHKSHRDIVLWNTVQLLLTVINRQKR